VSDEIIAIDGPAGSGKSTVARSLAQKLGWAYLDTGAMYRAVTYEVLRRGIDVDDAEAVGALASSVALSTLPRVTVDGRDVEDEIRTDQVNRAVSVVAANPLVRETMVERQREWAADQPIGTVVEGRDITTVVFPQATLKVFLTASLEERARRRDDETTESVQRRDRADSTRDASPLRQAHDALVLDTTGRDVDVVVGEIIECLTNQRLN
jgi:cytidylate kinase